MKTVFFFLLLFGLVLSAHSQVNLEQGLVASYRLNNNLIDSGPNQFDLTSGGGPSATTDRFGHASGAFQLFSSTPDYLTSSSSSEMNPGEVTLAAWVKLSDPETDQKIAGKAAVNQGGYLMGVQLHKLDAEIWDITGGHLRLQSGAIPTDVWTHVAISYKSSQYLRLFVNGVIADSIDATVYPLGSSGNSFTLGGAPWEAGALNMDGSLDDVYLYNRVLNSDEIRALFELVTDRKEELLSSQVSFYPLPVSDGKLYVDAGQPIAGVTTICICDALGKEVFRSVLQHQKEELNVSHLTKGVYLIQIASRNRFEFRTLMVN